ncbi:acyl-CoA dehydrogenase [Arenibaculum pallidiluteum]|uniref:acyl-CoA dehydrogenase n=1 Tax=Arenibaculum pallidiluteum TaxID=2812559 RepID=UPI001A966352|nr:acyl-CoA dehydrogenase [Arenibaculum pallidiluteum]
MTPYAAPIREISFVLDHVAGFGRVAELPPYAAATPDLVAAVLDEGGKLARDVFAPLNTVGDRAPPRLENGVVRMPEGFVEAYGRFVEGGWNAVQFDPEYGGQGLPSTLAMVLHEMWQASNLSFSLCPLLTQGAIEALAAHGSDAVKATYLPRMVSGEWTGTMNLTEPQAGSDLSQVRARAEPAGDGTYRITGQKIFITFGEHDLTENIVHLVLARLPDAPAGTRGISLFVVPKYLVNPDGSLGPRNDLRCAGLEHKLGIHASPTCVMVYGDGGGAVGTLVGEPNRGLEYMFTMMNNARLGVGLQGVAIAERAYQQARDYARTRIQSKDVADPRGAAVPILRHPDVRRMLLSMRARTEACRALAYYAFVHLDLAKALEDPQARALVQARVDLLTPVVKAWCTDTGVEVASTGVQIHGGVGFVEEAGAAQHYRDARIAPIYEGTNGIQANDLVFRKLARDGGAAAGALIAEMRETVDALKERPGDDLETIARALAAGIDTLETATRRLAPMGRTEPAAAAAGAAPYLRLFGIVAGGWLLARGALAAQDGLRRPDADHGFLDAKLVTARFFAEQVLVEAPGLLAPVTEGYRTILAFPEDAF